MVEVKWSAVRSACVIDMNKRLTRSGLASAQFYAAMIGLLQDLTHLFRFRSASLDRITF